MAFDLLIRGGILVDGTGLPRRRADVGVKDGLIAAVGLLDGERARRTIDADGRVVAPGIVDPHTHYDPQLTFDPYATSSCFHGVTSVVAGNCGFSIAPARRGDRAFVTQIFARVEDMSPRSLAAIPWDFESFPEFLASRRGRLGVNAGFYVGHSNVRRWVLGEHANRREATDAEIGEMRRLVREAMAAGAAGFSSSHAPTHCDSFDRPIPSRLASAAELESLVTEVGRARCGSISYLPYGSIGGLGEDDEELLIRLALASRLPVIIQGLGARSKVDAPTATWEHSRAYLDRCRERGAAVYSMLMARPFNRTFTIADGTSLYEGVPAFHRLFREAKTVAERSAWLRDPGHRDAIRHAVENPNRDPARGSTLPPPQFEVLQVHRAARPENAAYVGRSLREIAASKGVAPMDAMVEIALSEDLGVEFVWRTETDEWREGTYAASIHPSMVIGTSDGGAHLGRDDGAEFSSYFLRYWVREWGKWELEEAIRQMTQQPAALLGLVDRGMLLPGYAADVMIFDPATVGPGRKEYVHDFPGGEGRWRSWPEGVHATIVNGTPIVIEGELVEGCGHPGRLLVPGRRAGARE
jgi:N-acyl-D-aspartate/D-glutamate deacylase